MKVHCRHPYLDEAPWPGLSIRWCAGRHGDDGTDVGARGEGRAVRVAAGRRVRVVDVEGGQVGDLFAFAADDPREHLSAAHTRSVTSRCSRGWARRSSPIGAGPS
ncbi:DUF1989 domain-containing protein [Actinomadura luteofluorescens]|uniref:DUF1989 domain-containing protein n=1 Tax=Actinomadura luteofluorescens TaxID=46163 RepID=UPI00363E2DC0